LGWARSTFLLPPRSLAPATRCGRLPAPVLLGRTTERWRRERLPCHRPSRHSRAPISAQVLRSPHRERPDANDAATPSPEPREPLSPATRGASRPIIPCEIIARPASHRWSPPRQGDRSLRARLEPSQARRSRLLDRPPTGATPTPSSSSDDLRGWVVPGILSADLGFPPASEDADFPPGAFHHRSSTGRSLSHSPPARLWSGRAGYAFFTSDPDRP
jgi:hypothetical protein